MKVLVAEDSRVNLMVIKKYISSMGHDIVTAENGQEAIDKFKEEKPDLILMDVVMPIMDGHEATRQIKELCDEKLWVPILFLTSMQDDEDLAKGIEAGGDDYLKKPVSKIVLESKIHAMERISDMQKKLVEVTSQLEDANTELERLSVEDGLTKVPNRRRFDEALDMEWRRAIRENSDLTVIMMDIDHFKLFNDHYGHQGGDDCLIEVASALKGQIKRPGDLVARYGGEEFVVLLPKTNEKQGFIFANQLCDAVRKIKYPHEKSQTSDIVTISLGVSMRRADDKGAEVMLERADQALYNAKESGRNRVALSPKA